MVFGIFRRKRKGKKKARRKVKRKKAKRRGRKGKPFGGYMIKPDANLGKIIGNRPLPPSKMTKALWNYIKKHRLSMRG